MITENMIMKDERYKIIGAALEVHRTLGSGFTEYVYQDALEIEFQRRGIPYEREKHLPAFYKGSKLKHDYYVDFLCYGNIVVECKALSKIAPENEAQTLNYMSLGKFPLGYLINFGETSLVYKPYVKKEFLKSNQ